MSRSFAGINDELAALFNAEDVAGLAPAVEGRIGGNNHPDEEAAYGMNYSLDKAFSLDKDSFEKAVESAEIDAWTFRMIAPWSPGRQVSLVALDRTGAPFLSFRLTEDQPKLLVIRQVIGISEGVATFGNAKQYFFRCELTSESLVRFLKSAQETRADKKFIPTPVSNPIDEPSQLEDTNKRNKSEEPTPIPPSE